MSCTLHDVHEPQSDSASTTASTSSAMGLRETRTGAVRVLVGFAYRFTE